MKYYLIGYSVLMDNARKFSEVLHVFLVFKAAANTERNEALHNLSPINKCPSFPTPWRILNNNRLEMPKTSG